MLYYFKVFELNFVEFNNIKEPFDVFSGLERSFAHSSLHTREGYLLLKYILTHDSKQQLRYYNRSLNSMAKLSSIYYHEHGVTSLKIFFCGFKST